MKKILPKHLRFANPTQWRKTRNPDRRAVWRAFKTLNKILQRVMRPGLPRRVRVRIQDARPRRSAASHRRATADSGGFDSDGGDPEPPQLPHLYSLPAHRDGGAL